MRRFGNISQVDRRTTHMRLYAGPCFHFFCDCHGIQLHDAVPGSPQVQINSQIPPREVML